MNTALRAGWVRFAAAVWLTAATIAVGFSHRPLPGFPTAAAMVDAAGLVLGSVCTAGGGGLDESGPTTAKRGGVCDACLLASAPGLGAVAEIDPPTPPDSAPVRHVLVVEGARSRVGPRATARGPPVSA